MAKVLWTQKQDVGPSARGEHAIAYDEARERVVLFGGREGGATLQGDTWEWDGTDWTQVADTGPDARSGHALAFDAARERVVLFGGEAAGSALRGDTWEWDGDGLDRGRRHRPGCPQRARARLRRGPRTGRALRRRGSGAPPCEPIPGSGTATDWTAGRRHRPGCPQRTRARLRRGSRTGRALRRRGSGARLARRYLGVGRHGLDRRSPISAPAPRLPWP